MPRAHDLAPFSKVTEPGRIIDVDSHIMLPPDRLVAILGDAMSETLRRRITRSEVLRTQPLGDELKTHPTGLRAFGAGNPHDRVAVLDRQGYLKQVIFPTGLWDAMWTPSEPAHAAVRRYNDLAVEWANAGSGRLLPAMIVNLTNLSLAMAELDRILPSGIRVALFASNAPPAGLSPAADELDEIWGRLEESGCVVAFHVGSGGNFVDWRFSASRLLDPRRHAQIDGGQGVGPLTLQTMHYSTELFLTALIYGGVFDRFPRLNALVAELGARWVGPWVERMDAGLGSTEARRLMAMEPSAYVRKQIRVAPFLGEPIRQFVESYDLGDVFVFSSDFPHPEGGEQPLAQFVSVISPLGDELVRKFTHDNAARLFDFPIDQ